MLSLIQFWQVAITHLWRRKHLTILFAYRMMDNDELKERMRRRFLLLYISRIQYNSTWMIVWLSTNCSFVVFQDMFVDFWAELAPLLWPHNLCSDQLLYWRCCFKKTNVWKYHIIYFYFELWIIPMSPILINKHSLNNSESIVFKNSLKRWHNIYHNCISQKLMLPDNGSIFT